MLGRNMVDIELHPLNTDKLRHRCGNAGAGKPLLAHASDNLAIFDAASGTTILRIEVAVPPVLVTDMAEARQGPKINVHLVSRSR